MNLIKKATSKGKYIILILGLGLLGLISVSVVLINTGALAKVLSQTSTAGTDAWLGFIGNLLGAFIGAFLAVSGALWVQRVINAEKESLELRSAARFVYFDIVRGIGCLKKVAILRSLHQWDNEPKSLHISDQWLNNLTKISVKLSRDDLELMYGLYTDILVLQHYLHEAYIHNNDAAAREIHNYAIEVAQKVLNEDLLDYLHIERREIPKEERLIRKEKAANGFQITDLNVEYVTIITTLSKLTEKEK